MKKEKRLLTGREKFQENQKLIGFVIRITKVLPRSIRMFLWDWSSKYSQILFIGFRYVLLRTLIKQCGNNVRIGTNVQIVNWKGLEIGDNVSIHANCYIDAAGEMEIGNNVSIAHNCSLLSTNHGWVDISLPIKYNPVSFGKVVINEDVWIGCGCRILSNVVIGSRSIIAAGAVVNKSIDSNSIYGGIPARLIKKI